MAWCSSSSLPDLLTLLFLRFLLSILRKRNEDKTQYVCLETVCTTEILCEMVYVILFTVTIFCTLFCISNVILYNFMFFFLFLSLSLIQSPLSIP